MGALEEVGERIPKDLTAIPQYHIPLIDNRAGNHLYSALRKPVTSKSNIVILYSKKLEKFYLSSPRQ